MKFINCIGWAMIALLGALTCLAVLTLMATLASGAELLVGHGTHIQWKPDWCSEATAQDVVEVEIRERITPWFTLGLVGQRLRAKVEPGHVVDGHWYEGSDATAALHFRMGLQSTYGRFVGELFGGFGLHLGHQTELGPSHVLGHFGVGLGIRLGRNTLQYKVWHMSDPLQSHDFGWNIQTLSLEIPLW